MSVQAARGAEVGDALLARLGPDAQRQIAAELAAPAQSGETSPLTSRQAKQRRRGTPRTAPKGQKRQRGDKTDAERARDEAEKRAREDYIAANWALLAPDIPLARQHRFHPARQFRADFAVPAARIWIDYQGGTWSQGPSGHKTGSGIREDVDKLNNATLLGWSVFYLTADMVTRPKIAQSLQPIIDFARARLAALAETP